jgi:hypothetical protein
MFAPNLVTFTISLPADGLFEEQIDALQKAKERQIQLQNPAAAHAIHSILCLAKRGKLAFDMDTAASAAPRSQTPP